MFFTIKQSSFSLDRRSSETFHYLQAFLECQAVRSIQWSRRGWTTGAAHQPRLLRQTFLRPQLLRSQRRSLWPRKKERSPSSPAAWGETDPAWLLPMLSGGACELAPLASFTRGESADAQGVTRALSALSICFNFQVSKRDSGPKGPGQAAMAIDTMEHPRLPYSHLHHTLVAKCHSMVFLCFFTRIPSAWLKEWNCGRARKIIVLALILVLHWWGFGHLPQLKPLQTRSLLSAHVWKEWKCWDMWHWLS